MANLLLPKNAHQIMINGPVGLLDTMVSLPKTTPQGIAIVIHPDPKGGGNNTNKIVQTVAKVLTQKGCICYCPNLRGVGSSDGIHDFGRGEVDDCLAVYNHARHELPELPLILAGFSFGTTVVSHVATQVEHKHLILIGPAVGRYPILVPDRNKTLVIHGDQDEIISYAEVAKWAIEQDIPISVFMQTGHFFHRKLVNLQSYLNQIVTI